MKFPIFPRRAKGDAPESNKTSLVIIFNEIRRQAVKTSEGMRPEPQKISVSAGERHFIVMKCGGPVGC